MSLESKSSTVRLVAVGDLMLGDSVGSLGFGFASRYRASGVQPFRQLQRVLPWGDIVFGNLEVVLSRRSSATGKLARDQMRGLPAFATGLAEAGFTMLSVANNHADQHGSEAFHDTLDALEGAGLRYCGLPGAEPWKARPEMVETRDGRIGVLAYNLRPPQYGEQRLFARGRREEIVADVQRLAPTVTWVVVSLHWGLEFVDSPSRREVELARAVSAAGASVVLGHHPHVPRRVEEVDRGVIAYSLGNFVSDQLWLASMRRSMVLSCGLGPAGARVEEIRLCEISDDYLPSRRGTDRSTILERSTALPEAEYEREHSRMLAVQRWKLYLYTMRNVHRIPFSVIVELIARTTVNKLRALWVTVTGQRAGSRDVA